MSNKSARKPARKPRALRITEILGVLFALLVLGALSNWLLPELNPDAGPIDVAPTAAPPAGEADNRAIQVFFTTPQLRYPDLRAQRTESALAAALVADLDRAGTSIDIASFDFDLGPIGEALLRARQRGVTVRAVVDSENLQTPEVADLMGRLQRARIPVVFDDREAFMHNKFVVIDRAVVWTGSWNVTENDTFRNNNNFVRLASKSLATVYADEFSQMVGGLFGPNKIRLTERVPAQVGGAQVRVYFSPKDGVASYVVEQIDRAQRSVRFMAFSYTAAPVADAMIAKLNAGLKVSGVMEKQNAGGRGSQYDHLVEAGVDAIVDGNCYIMHHKTIIIDDRIVITGSYNFTNNAERDNDENLVIIDDARIAKRFIEEYDRVRRQALTPTRCG